MNMNLTTNEYHQVLLIGFMMVFVFGPAITFLLWDAKKSIKKLNELADEMDRRRALKLLNK